MNQRLQILKYLIADFFSAAAAWFVFNVFRKEYIESANYGYKVSLDYNFFFFINLVTIPLFWLTIYYFFGSYRDVFRKSRLQELGQTFYSIILGVVIIFFTLILDDTVFNYRNYYFSFWVLFLLQFVITYVFRLIITTRNINSIKKGKIGFNTLLIGSNGKALDLYRKLSQQDEKYGYFFKGFISIYDKKEELLSKELKHLGNLSNLQEIIISQKIEEVIIAVELSEHKEIQNIIYELQKVNVIIKVIPAIYDIIVGKVKMSSFLGTPLIIISQNLIPAWQENVKRSIDITFSLFTLIFLSPVYLVLAVAIKLSSEGPVIYKQERIGKNQKPFNIYKFRTMIVNAEENGPQLSSKEDGRITKLGKFLRKTRLDEIPQFVNVLKNDMSIVGPRPERQYFIDKIMLQAPHYLKLLKVKPGITSWGQVKFGYAENVSEMIERLNYDIFYIENMSVYLDIKIMIHTVKVIWNRNGK